MKVYGYVTLLILISTSIIAKEDDLDVDSRNVDKQAESIRRVHSPEKDLDIIQKLFDMDKRNKQKENSPAAEANSRNSIRVSVFNGDKYDARVKINYLLLGEERENILSATIKQGEHQSTFVPKAATYLRVSFSEKDAPNHQRIIGEEIDDLSGTTSVCYLLVHKNSRSIYGHCPVSYREMVEAWENDN